MNRMAQISIVCAALAAMVSMASALVVPTGGWDKCLGF